MNLTILSLNQFRFSSITRDFQKLQNNFYPIKPGQYKSISKDIKVDSFNIEGYTPIHGVNKNTGKMVAKSIIFFSVFMLFNLILLTYYCIRVRKMREVRSDYSIDNFSLISNKSD